MQPPTSGNVYNILEGNKQYIIPVYQRIYTWTAFRISQDNQKAIIKPIIESEEKRQWKNQTKTLICL